MSKLVEKRFPADINMSYKTFLNDKEIDGVLYSVLLSLSYPKDKETCVDKYTMPSQKEMCERCFLGDTRTYKKHLQRLMDKGYVVDCDTYYLLPRMEDIFLAVPLDTILFFNDVLKEDVIKTFIYLGQIWKKSIRDKSGLPSFTKLEVLNHIGLKKGQSRLRFVSNALLVLKNNGLINYAEYFDGKSPRMRLTAFSLEVKK